ncbi:hypothetical protein K1X84_11365 [bacterium]|nr:hypothetical protein [bacterium]
MKRLLSTLLLAMLVTGTAWSGEPKDFSTVIKEIVDLMQETNKTGKPQRLAVVTFIPTKAADIDKKNEFGEYITESLISAVGAKKNLFKLFERKRLDAVLKENDFMLSDLVDQNQAQKVGELLPIDILFSGTYTRLKNYIDVNSRLIDVVTGEILMSFSGRVKMTDDLASLFPEENQTTVTANANKESELDRCKQQAKELKTKLNDLSSDDKVQNLVKDAIKIPFDVQCGAVHFDVLYSFKRYKIENASYEQFLNKTLDTIAYPSNDDRAYEIFRFFGRDSLIDNSEWKLGLKTLKKVGNYRLASHIKYLLQAEPIGPNLDKICGRMDEFFELVRANQVGLPTPIDMTAAFFQMAEGVKSDKDQRLRIYLYENYSRYVTLDKETSKKIYSILVSMYKNETDGSRKTKILDWIAEWINQNESNEKNADQAYDFVRSFLPTTNKETNKRIATEYPQSDLERLVGLCKDKLSEYALMTPYNSQKEDRINFCVDYDVPVAGAIPTMPEAQTILDGEDWEEQQRILKLLVRMKDRPKPLESSLIKIMDKKSLDHKDDLKKMQPIALAVLGNIRSSNPKAIDHMIASLMSFDYYYSDNAKNALVQIGKPAVKPLIAKLQATTIHDGGLQYIIIEILGRIGKDAKEAVPVLQAMLQKTINKDVKYALEAALQSMQ